MTRAERRATSTLASIFALRMFGLFLVLPVLALYARDLPGASVSAIGLALGIYGACQAIFQVPYGIASDRFGRKPVITVGLLVFAAGSLLAGSADTMTEIIFGRALQGAGAVSAAVLALTADLTRDVVRTRAMAAIGISIGGSFVLALMVGPALAPFIGVNGLFYLTAALVFCAIVVVWTVVPNPQKAPVSQSRGSFVAVLRDTRLLRLDFAMMVIHATLMALFVVIPVELSDRFGMVLTSHFKIYIPVLLVSIIPFAMLVRVSHKPGNTRPVLLAGGAMMLASVAVLVLGGGLFWAVVFALILFFSGFNTLEAMLPSLVSRISPAAHKGAALGLFNTSQFAGIFIGGVAGGLLLEQFGPTGVYVALVLIATLLTLALATGRGLEPVAPDADDTAIQTREIELRIGARTPVEAESLSERLGGYVGVLAVQVDALEGRALLRVDSQRFDMRLLDEFVETVNTRVRPG